MTHRSIRFRLVVLLCLSLASFSAANAADVSVQARPEFKRVNFTFAQTPRLQLSGNGSSTITLTFNQPAGDKAAALKAQLAPAVKAVRASADGKTLTLTLDKPYRTRQFVSGRSVGFDLLTAAPLSPQPAAEKPPVVEEKPVEKPLPTPVQKPPEKKVEKKIEKKPVADPVKPSPAKIEKKEPVKAPPVAAKKEETVTKKEEIAPSVPKEEPAPKVVEPKKPTEPVVTQPIQETPDTVYSTKQADEKPAVTAETAGHQPAPVDALAKPTQKAPPEPDATSIYTSKEPSLMEAVPTAPILEAVKPAPSVEKTEEKPAPKKEEAKAVPTVKEEPKATAAPVETVQVEETADPSKPFIVSTKDTPDGTLINFPWTSKTAAAIYEKAGNIWIIFSAREDVKPKLLASLLPKSVIRVEQYDLPESTVLRLTTDGTWHASASQQGTYGWNILLSPKKPKATSGIAATGEENNGKYHLLLSVFDSTEPLVFYDPLTSERMIVIPTFTPGRGVVVARNFQGMSIIDTQQGVAVASQRDDITPKRTAAGIELHGLVSLAASANLPLLSSASSPVAGLSAASNVLMPYDQWHVTPRSFHAEKQVDLRNFVNARPEAIPSSLQRLVELYMAHGLAVEASGYLRLIKEAYPDYYAEKKLAVISAAAHLLMYRVAEAQLDIAAPELNNVPEAGMWRQFLAMYQAPLSDVQRAQNKLQETEGQTASTVQEPPKTFDFMNYNKSFIRYYPPRLRQRLAILSADAYINDNQEELALKVYETLNNDGILTSVQPYAEFMLGKIAAKKNKVKEALEIFDQLIANRQDRYIETRARFARAMLLYSHDMASASDTIESLHAIRFIWRGDGLERQLLYTLAQMSKEAKRYDESLRAWESLLEAFPEDPDVLTISGNMGEMFEDLFLNGRADDMEPLRALGLFYEFRQLTPVGAKGDLIIQKLADRLAAVDLIDRATQLLEHQIKYRVTGEDRARVGARLGLLFLLNKQPQEALTVLQTTNYGNTNPDLRRQRTELTAQALNSINKHEEALSILYSDNSRSAALLRLEILWDMKDWPNVINQAEDTLAERANLTAPLSIQETEILLKLALAYSFEGDDTQLRYLRDYYTGLLPDTQYKQIFDYLTNDNAPLDAEDFMLISKQISYTESFLDTFRKQIAAGRLSEAVN